MVRLTTKSTASQAFIRPAAAAAKSTASSKAAFSAAVKGAVATAAATRTARTLGVTRPTVPVSGGGSAPATASNDTTADSTATSSNGVSSTASANTAAADSGALPNLSDVFPTAESIFGNIKLYQDNPTLKLPDGSSMACNNLAYATPEAAQVVAQLLGGTVVACNNTGSSSGPVQQNQLNQMVQFDNGVMVNAGYVVSYYTHHWSATMINNALAEVRAMGNT